MLFFQVVYQPLEGLSSSEVARMVPMVVHVATPQGYGAEVVLGLCCPLPRGWCPSTQSLLSQDLQKWESKIRSASVDVLQHVPWSPKQSVKDWLYDPLHTLKWGVRGGIQYILQPECPWQ